MERDESDLCIDEILIRHYSFLHFILKSTRLGAAADERENFATDSRSRHFVENLADSQADHHKRQIK